MTTATAPFTDRERLEIIWRTATRDVARFTDRPGISLVNSERWLTIDNTLEELAGLLVNEISDHPRPDGSTEFSDLTCVTDDIWEFIEARLIDYALDIEGHRRERKAGKAA